MSELCCKIQVPALNTVGGVTETRTVLQSLTEGHTYEGTRKNDILCNENLVAGHKKKLEG